MHEAMFSTTASLKAGVSTLDLAKALIDEGFHPMTMYFPLVVHGAMLIEPTETESKASLDQFIARAALDRRARQERRRPRASRRRRSTPRAGGSTRRWRRASRCCAGGPRTIRPKVIR